MGRHGYSIEIVKLSTKGLKIDKVISFDTLVEAEKHIPTTYAKLYNTYNKANEGHWTYVDTVNETIYFLKR